MNTTTCYTQPASRLVVLVLFACTLLYSVNSFANSADWGLVQRFNGQLQKAQEGKISAMYNVGRLYEKGRGTSRDYKAAIKWYQKAADAGNPSAKARLGKMYLEGKGVNKDPARAHQLMLAAARSDVPAAQYQLGIMYEIGIGTGASDEKALFWYRKAASQGHYQAERKLAKLSSAPVSVPKSQPVRSAPSTPATRNTNQLIDSIASGEWKRGKRIPGYLPSTNSNCKKTGQDSLLCISTEQERNTGNELITFNTEAVIKAGSGNSFSIEYVNNVLDVELLENEIVSGVETDDEASNEATRQTSIKKGKQEKVHHLDCSLKTNRSISCLKDKISTLNFIR